uniref:SEA domain-containing protein n=1 Tax=Ditylum brightwellii TaxID=49249 RepID=A0A7S4RPE3_9STRA
MVALSKSITISILLVLSQIVENVASTPSVSTDVNPRRTKERYETEQKYQKNRYSRRNRRTLKRKLAEPEDSYGEKGGKRGGKKSTYSDCIEDFEKKGGKKGQDDCTPIASSMPSSQPSSMPSAMPSSMPIIAKTEPEPFPTQSPTVNECGFIGANDETEVFFNIDMTIENLTIAGGIPDLNNDTQRNLLEDALQVFYNALIDCSCEENDINITDVFTIEVTGEMSRRNLFRRRSVRTSQSIRGSCGRGCPSRSFFSSSVNGRSRRFLQRSLVSDFCEDPIQLFVETLSATSIITTGFSDFDAQNVTFGQTLFVNVPSVSPTKAPVKPPVTNTDSFFFIPGM